MRDLNFFSEFLIEKKNEKVSSNITIYTAIAMLIILAIFLSAAFNFIRLRQINNEIQKSEDFLNDEKNLEKIKEVEDISSQIDQIQKDSDLLTNVDAQIKNNSSVMIKVLEFLNDQVTEDMYFDELKVANRKIEILGKALTKVQIAQFEYNIRNSGYFEEVFVNEIKREEQERITGQNPGKLGNFAYTFDILFKVKDSVYKSVSNPATPDKLAAPDSNHNEEAKNE